MMRKIIRLILILIYPISDNVPNIYVLFFIVGRQTDDSRRREESVNTKDKQYMCANVHQRQSKRERDRDRDREYVEEEKEKALLSLTVMTIILREHTNRRGY